MIALLKPKTVDEAKLKAFKSHAFFQVEQAAQEQAYTRKPGEPYTAYKYDPAVSFDEGLGNYTFRKAEEAIVADVQRSFTKVFVPMEKGGDGAFTERKKPLDIQCKIESVNVHDGRGEKPKCRLIIKLDYANAADHYAALKRAEDKIRDAKCELYNEEIGVPPHMHREMRLIANTPDQLKEGYLILMKAGKREFHLGYRVNDNDLKLKLPKPGQQVS